MDFVLTASKSRGIFDVTVRSGGHCEDSNVTHTLYIQYNSTLNDIILEMRNPKLSVGIVKQSNDNSNNSLGFPGHAFISLFFFSPYVSADPGHKTQVES